MLFMQLGLDGKKHPWLAWLESDGGAVLGPVKLLELDPKTLAPRTSSAVVPPGGSTAIDFRLACAASCRVVLADLSAATSGRRRQVSAPRRRWPRGRERRPRIFSARRSQAGHVTSGSITLRRAVPTKACSVRRRECSEATPRLARAPRRVGRTSVHDQPAGLRPLRDVPVLRRDVRAGRACLLRDVLPEHDTRTRVLAGVVPVR